MKKGQQGNHAIITWEDRYYDGYDVDYYDERLVSDWMREGTEDCIEYMDVVDSEVLWVKNNMNK
ncbi:hypothetical protein [Paenibacillus sp. QZ-Y1]|uniref:hypothetical protein n=1 Tax=Paenibacillus sp. QZ-Y1 TaxID=3414511 RepID=UPI003F7A853D